MAYDLECERVRKRFGGLAAVDGVSFRIPSGSFFSILGPSGCGKTTLLRMIAGFEAPNEGDILIKGRSVLALPPNRRNVKLVFQHLALFPMMNVEENIAYGLRCKGMAKDEIARRTADVLERVGLPDAHRKDVGQLSGGQKQRIAIARCMVLDPDVLLLDEPLGALDLKLREHMKIELKMLQSRFGTTFLYITHDQSEALVMSDRVAVMNDGRFEQVGEPRELYHDPKTAFVAGFVGDSNRWPGRVLDRDPAGMRVETRSGPIFTADATDGELGKGDAVDVFVRPESIAVTRGEGGEGTGSQDPGGGINRRTGRIEGVLFNGANTRILARTAAGDRIEADLPQGGTETSLGNGDPVTLTWKRTSAKCFARADGTQAR